MRVHVIVASRHGATSEIGAAIRDTLRDRGLDVDLVELDRTAPPDLRFGPDDVIVLGSAIYAGSWIKAARHLLERYEDEIKHHRTWLFSSGPLGDRHNAEGMDPTRLATMALDTGAVDHHIFAGRLDRSQLGRGERLIAAAVRAPDGDFRDWAEVEAWANEVADAVATPV